MKLTNELRICNTIYTFVLESNIGKFKSGFYIVEFIKNKRLTAFIRYKDSVDGREVSKSKALTWDDGKTTQSAAHSLLIAFLQNRL